LPILSKIKELVAGRCGSNPTLNHKVRVGLESHSLFQMKEPVRAPEPEPAVL